MICKSERALAKTLFLHMSGINETDDRRGRSAHGSVAERWRTRSQPLDPHAHFHEARRSETSAEPRIRYHGGDG